MHLVSLGVSVLTLKLLSPCVNERVDRWTRQTMRRAERGLGVRVGVRQPMITMTKGHNSDYEIIGRRPNGFLGLSLNGRTILFLFDKTVSVG